MTVMQEFQLSWPEHEQALTEPQQILDLLTDLDRKFELQRRSVLVGIDSATASLDVGLGIFHCAIYLQGEDEDGSLSLGLQDPEEELAFEHDVDAAIVPASVVVDKDDAFLAVTEFLATGERPTNLMWQTMSDDNT